MSIELLILFGILLARAQRALTPLVAANQNQQAANAAAAAAADAAAKGDHATAAAKSAEAAQHQAAASSAAKAVKTPPPWPQAVPGALPPFPGPGWGPASPVTSAMAARAWQLLPELWAHGEGTWKTEKTNDRWVTYKAAHTSPGKKGVIAYTVRSGAPAAAAPSAQPAMAMAPVAAPRPAAGPVVPASAVTPAAPVQPASTEALHAAGVPTLRLTSPRMTGPTIVWLQQQLGIQADGSYGTGTEAAVRHYQAAHHLPVDGVVGKDTWASLGVGVKAAA
jgi:hypothetical protein